MRELYDPVYYPPNIQGFDDPYQQQYLHHHQQQLHHRPVAATTSATSSSKSSSSSSVLGRFLKLGKSKSDASLSGNNGGGLGFSLLSTSSSSSAIGGGGGRYSSSGGGCDELDDFRLPPSVIARGPVEKMVHKANSRKDVSRSHSWIYGSVKLPSDLPFGYGDQFSFHEGGDDGEGEQQHRHHPNDPLQQQPRTSSSSGHYLHTHSLQSMQIPRCQLDYYCTCDCGGGGGDDRGGMLMSPSGRPIAGGSVRAGGLKRNKSPCQGCAREMAMSSYALPSAAGKSRKSGGDGTESFVSSVRKLTWKSLKQVVKKRPSLDTLKKIPPQQQQILSSEYHSAPVVPMPYLSPSAVAAASATSASGGMDMISPPLSPSVNTNPMANLMNNQQSHYGNPFHNQQQQQRLSHHPHPSLPYNGAMTSAVPHSPNPRLEQPVAAADDPHQQNYFFPEKKGFYASCNDIYGGEPPPHVTASVRVRPKRTRQPWQFPSATNSNEFGPVPNYEEETDQQQLYHSEWDLRNVMSYDVWMNTTSNVKPRSVAPGPSSNGSNASSKQSGKSSVAHHSTERHNHHSMSSGNLHVPPPDYAPSEPTTTFRPQQHQKAMQQSRSSPNLDKVTSSSSKSSNNGSVKMTKSSSASSQSGRSLTSLHSPSIASTTSSKRSGNSKNVSHNSKDNSDTLTISTFANTPSNPNKSKNKSNEIVKRSSILAADVTAYQLLKAQTKKASSSNAKSSSTNNDGGVHQSILSPVHQTNVRSLSSASTRHPPSKKKEQQPQEELDDAFSESSDDLSDNAITGSSDHTVDTASNANHHNAEGKSRGGVRIAGQGIRMAPNSSNGNRNNLKTNNSKSSSTVMSPAITSNSNNNNKGQNRTSTFTNYQQSNNRNQQRNSAAAAAGPSLSNKNGSKIIRQSSSSSEDDVWSDCHTELETMKLGKMMRIATVEHHHHPQNANNKNLKQQHVPLSSSSSRERSGNNKTVLDSSPSSSPSNVTSSNSNKTNGQISNQNGGDGGGMGATRPTFVTFDVKPQQFHENNMEFEEYEYDDNAIATSREPQVKSSNSSATATNVGSSASTSISKTALSSMANLKSASDNVVSLNVTRSPTIVATNHNASADATSSTGGSNNVSGSPHHPTYIKHSKSQQSSTSSVAATGKFGALRRRKSRSGSNGTSPGKLLQETIYEEDVEQVEDCNPQQNHSSSISAPVKANKPPEHAVKIKVSNGGVVKPILKNRGTYETPVTNQNANFNGSGSCNNNSSSASNTFGMSSFENSSSNPHQQIHNQSFNASSSSANSNDIYFDSSISTVSTASKKKVQFDQRPEVVVCGGDSSSQDSYDEENDDSDQWSNKSEDDEMMVECQQQKQQSSGINDEHDKQQQQLHFHQSHNNRHHNSVSAQHQQSHYQHQPAKTGPTMNGNCQNSEKLSSSIVERDGLADSKRARSSFEEEVVRKAALFAKSRQEAAEAKRKKEAEEKEAERKKEEESYVQSEANRNGEDSDDVNNLHHRRFQKNQPVVQITSSPSMNANNKATAVASRGNGGCSATIINNNKKSTANSQGSANIIASNNGIVDSAKYNKNNASSTSTLVAATASQQKTGSSCKNGNDSTFFDSNKATAEIGTSPSNRILNPNSLLFHDTTRIRLNQSRPALHDNTFKLPNGNGSPQMLNKKGATTRLKQSNSFRSVSSLTLRPREPPPPPPGILEAGKTGGKSSFALSVPARLQKALSTSTLLSKSTEKLNLSPSLSSKSVSSHYGPGGKLLPSKSQISLPLGFTTTSKTAGLLASGSVDKLNIPGSSPKDIQKQTFTSVTPSNNIRHSGGVKGRLSKSSTNLLATRSKSLTDRCEALEKVLMEQKRESFILEENSQLRRSTPSLHTLSHASLLPKDDMDSKNIEIVTKENAVSEIRIYSASSATGLTVHPAEPLPYQGIIYEATKTMITTTPTASAVPEPSPPLPPANGINVIKDSIESEPKPPEIHYAATDLFQTSATSPAPTIPPHKKQQEPPQLPQRSTINSAAGRPPPFSHPPLPPLPTSGSENDDGPGKSVLLIIDNSNKGKNKQQKQQSQFAKKDDHSLSTLPAYSQPIDTITTTAMATTASTTGGEMSTNRCATHHPHPPPQIPLPSIPFSNAPEKEVVGDTVTDWDDLGEPLYDDVINHSAGTSAADLPQPPSQPPTKLNGKSSLGRKSIGPLISSTLPLPPHQLGELPPLPPPPVPPHRTPVPSASASPSSGQVVSSTIPCPACPPTLPPPNLPSKSLSEFHNRPLIIQESEDDGIINHGFPPSAGGPSLDEEVDNLYNDIGTPTSLPVAGISGSNSHSQTMKSNSAASFASAMKEALLGAIGNNKQQSNKDFDKRSVLSCSSSGSKQSGDVSTDLIYDDTLSVRSSSSLPKTRLINHHNQQKTIAAAAAAQQLVPLPLPPTQILSNKLVSSAVGFGGKEKDTAEKVILEEENDNEPLYDDVLNVTGGTDHQEKKDNHHHEKCTTILKEGSVSGSEYHSSNASDSGTEDLPPPLPAQGPPPLPKGGADLPLLTFPLLNALPTVSQPSSQNQQKSSSIAQQQQHQSSTGKKGKAAAEKEKISEGDQSKEHLSTDSRTRTLLTELNEKLSKLNFVSSPQAGSCNVVGGVILGNNGNKNNNASSSSPGSSSLSSSGTTGGGEGQDSSDFSSYHISKVVISPSSESSGVEEDYNSEKNYSLSNGSDAASSGGGSDNENYNNNSNNNGKSKGNTGKVTSTSSGGASSNTPSAKMPSESISLARGKFLENMKLSMLSSMGANNPQGLLMMTTNNSSVVENSADLIDADDEPIYEEIGEMNSHQPPIGVSMKLTEKKDQRNVLLPNAGVAAAISPEEVEGEVVDLDDDDDNRSTSPVYADAFDAKSMFDGASRSEILSFLESIRDRLTGAESQASSSESQSSSISRSSTATGTSTSTKKSLICDPILSMTVDESPETTAVEESNRIVEGREESTGTASSSLPEMQIKLGESPILSRRQIRLCPDCNDDIPLDDQQEEGGKDLSEGDRTVNTGVAHPPPLFPGVEEDKTTLNSRRVAPSTSGLCRSCNRKRNEKKEIIMEIYETELKYGRDLRIISEEFYKPIQIAGLLTKEQLDQIFLNVDQLIQINLELTGRLKAAIQQSSSSSMAAVTSLAATQETSNKLNGLSEESLETVNVGKIFIELGEPMMTAFESYCTRQANAGALLSQLEKEKELLRIFLRVSQMENTVLRRMNLPAFLMVPVQRVTRYPLLLSRLLKVTPADHFFRDELQSAQEKIEQNLEHMNKTTREVGSVKLWRRISIINGNSSSSNNNNNGPAHRRSNSDLDTSNIRIRKMAMDVLDWANFNDVTCVIDTQLGCVHLNGKLLRNIYGCVLARGKDMEALASKIQDQDPFFPPAEDVVKDVKLVLVRVKNTRFCLLREPLCLSKCVVSQGENEFQEYIEINEITTKNTYFIQGLDKQSTSAWLKFLQCYSSCVGHWRRRRPALANIMMNGMIKHL